MAMSFILETTKPVVSNRQRQDYKKVLEPSLLPWKKYLLQTFSAYLSENFLRQTFDKSCLKTEWNRPKELRK